MSTRSILLAGAIAAVAGLAAGCSQLDIRVEVHDGSGLRAAPGAATEAAEVLLAAEQSLDGFEGRVIDELAVRWEQSFRELANKHQQAMAQTGSVADTMRAILRDVVLDPESRAKLDSLLKRAAIVRKQLLANPERSEVVREAKALAKDLDDLAAVLEERAAGVAARAAATLQNQLIGFYTDEELIKTQWEPLLDVPAEQRASDKGLLAAFDIDSTKNDATAQLADAIGTVEGVLDDLGTLTEREITSSAELEAAVQDAPAAIRRQIAEATADLQVEAASEGLTLETVTNLKKQAQQLLAVKIITLADENIPQVIGASDEHWKRFVNDVSVTGWFGNSQMAVKMEALGEFHLKSALFNPSRVAKATLDAVKEVVKIAAAAYGAPGMAAAAPAGGGESSATATTASAPSGPAIEAEIGRLTKSARTRTIRKRQLFDECVALASQLGTGETVPADVQTELLDRVRSLADRIKAGE